MNRETLIALLNKSNSNFEISVLNTLFQEYATITNKDADKLNKVIQILNQTPSLYSFILPNMLKIIMIHHNIQYLSDNNGTPAYYL